MKITVYRTLEKVSFWWFFFFFAYALKRGDLRSSSSQLSLDFSRGRHESVVRGPVEKRRSFISARKTDRAPTAGLKSAVMNSGPREQTQ